MADTGIFATTAEVQRKVGANASATANVEAFINQYMTEAEAEINVTVEFNFSDTYSALNVDVQGLLKEAASNLAAIYVINYDLGGFNTIGEAQSRITVLRDAYLRTISVLRDKDQQQFMSDA